MGFLRVAHTESIGSNYPWSYAPREHTRKHGIPYPSIRFLPLSHHEHALQVFKTYSLETINVALYFVQDLKLGHYIKIPPRASFMVQAISTLLCVTCQIAVKEWMFATTPNICERNQPN